MRKIALILVIIFSLLILGQGCVKKEEKPTTEVVPSKPLPAESITGNVNEVGQGISDIDKIDKEINMSDLDDIEMDLNDINW